MPADVSTENQVAKSNLSSENVPKRKREKNNTFSIVEMISSNEFNIYFQQDSRVVVGKYFN